MDKLKPDASAVYVPGDSCAKAIMDAIEAEVPLVMAVAEHVPIHDILRVGFLVLSSTLFSRPLRSIKC